MHFSANNIHGLPVKLSYIAAVTKNRRKIFKPAIGEYRIYTGSIGQIILIESKELLVQHINGGER